MLLIILSNISGISNSITMWWLMLYVLLNVFFFLPYQHSSCPHTAAIGFNTEMCECIDGKTYTLIPIANLVI